MDAETTFYVLGIGLVVIALVVSAIGLRWERFPGSRGLLVGATAAFAALVVATGVFAWQAAEDEQEHREEERAHALEEAEPGEEQEIEGRDGEEPAPTTGGVDGSEVFANAGCGGCHALSAAGTTADVGPNLDGISDRSRGYIRTSILDPDAVVVEGYQNVMPSFEGQLSEEELEALVDYLIESSRGAASG